MFSNLYGAISLAKATHQRKYVWLEACVVSAVNIHIGRYIERPEMVVLKLTFMVYLTVKSALQLLYLIVSVWITEEIYVKYMSNTDLIQLFYF